MPVIVVTPALNVPGILTAPVEPLIVIRVVLAGACKNIPPVPLDCKFKLILASVPVVAIPVDVIFIYKLISTSRISNIKTTD